MFIIKRDGSKEQVKLDKVSKRITNLSKDLKHVDAILIAQKVIQGLYDGVSSKELDLLAVETAYSMSAKHPEYDTLATRLVISALHKDTVSMFSDSVKILSEQEKTSLSPTYIKLVKKNAKVLDAAIQHSRDYLFDYFGFKTLERSYLLRKFNSDGSTTIIERPQYMWMRVALEIHGKNINEAINTYNLMSTKQFTHATPTLFNSGLVKNQQSSCFLLAMKDDSISGIYDTLKEAAMISQSAGGIGLHVSGVRSKGSPIRGTGGTSNGLIPMLRNFNETMRYVDQGGGKRKGSAAIYLEPWHGDILDFLELRKNQGKEELRARDLNLALWCPELFFTRVKEKSYWTLMDPNSCPGLSDAYGEDFDKLYTSYEEKGLGKRVNATDIWSAMLTSQIETGQPYILNKDSANLKSNQKNLGTIKSSNLCAEIIEFSSPEETAVCNLASISLPACIEGKKYKREFNFDKLYQLTKQVTYNLNNVIDNNYYPVEPAENSNMQHRPIGIGIQGLADVFALLRYNWDSDEAKKLNAEIAETMYYATIEASHELAVKDGYYKTFPGSPLSEGQLQFDLWGITPTKRYDWDKLKEKVKKQGVRNSLHIALMPTASTSQILGNTECFEPITSNLYKRQTLSGEFTLVNKYLVEDLIELDLWSETLRQKIIAGGGSVQHLAEIPEDIRKLYRTVWELSQKTLIDLSADRAPFVCQSQSLNLFFKEPNFAKLSSAYMYANQKGLKTLVYYTRSQAAREAIMFSVPKEIEEQIRLEKELKDAEDLECSLENPEACEACSG